MGYLRRSEKAETGDCPARARWQRLPRRCRIRPEIYTGGRDYYFCSESCLKTFESPEWELKDMKRRVSIALTGVLVSTVHSFLAFFIIYILLVSVGYNTGFFIPYLRR
jgi:uncharacterized membrane protein YbhN (UPF0104 family)